MTEVRLVLHSRENGRRRQRTLPPARDWPSRWGDRALGFAVCVIVACMVFPVVMLALLGMGR